MPRAIPTHKPFRADAKRHRVRTDGGWYDDKRWRVLRSAYLRRHPLCADPYGYHAQDCVTVPATEVHHVVDRRERPELSYDPANLQALCVSCHNRTTRVRQDTNHDL